MCSTFGVREEEEDERETMMRTMSEDEMNESLNEVEGPMVGDVWRDLDPRSKGREIKIGSVREAQGVAKVQSMRGGPQTTIRLDRFKASRSPKGGLGKKGFVLMSRLHSSSVVTAPDVPSISDAALASLAGGLGSSHDDA